MSFRHRQAPCAASSPQHQQTPCATAFSVSLDCVCCFIFIKFAPLFYIWARKSNLPRLDNFSRNQNWHAAIYPPLRCLLKPDNGFCTRGSRNRLEKKSRNVGKKYQFPSFFGEQCVPNPWRKLVTGIHFLHVRFRTLCMISL